MKKSIKIIRGMKDYMPSETSVWQNIENILKKVLVGYGYREIRIPIIESTILFQRIIGETTDIIKKEMYTFKDRKGNSLTLRPEGTAGCARAVIEHNILHDQNQYFWYIGPMFRYERPQSGRYRQFNQLGVEIFGLEGPFIDVELIMLNVRWWNILGISEHLSLEINSIGSLKERLCYSKELFSFLEHHKDKLDNNSKNIMYINPIRLLDSKDKKIQELLNLAPMINNYIDDNSRNNFNVICKLLDKFNISYTINQRLVRGLDYYNDTVFEWTTKSLGSQGTVCAGGRYDDLIRQIGGKPTPAIGCAVGLERLVLLVKKINPDLKSNSMIELYLISLCEETKFALMKLAEHIRNEIPDIKLMIDHNQGKLKKKIARANKLGAKLLLILGKLELASNEITVKNLLSGEQKKVMQNNIIAYLIKLNFKKIN